MTRLSINDLTFFVKNNISILEACEFVGFDVPRFCFHSSLSIAGNCRLCLVEISGSPKPVASCALNVFESLKLYVNSPLVKKARENILEALLINHPLDCPICDQAGECDLQDQTRNFGSNVSRYFFSKRIVEDKNCGFLIKTIMTRCIHCTRCVRFNSEISGKEILGTLNRGVNTEIGLYSSENGMLSELMGNVIDLCPVGALTSKEYAFKARPWELRVVETVDLSDSTGSIVYINFKETDVLRVYPKTSNNLKTNIISDKTRFSYDAYKYNRLINKQKDKTFQKVFNLHTKKLYYLFLAQSTLDLENLFVLKSLSNSNKNYFEAFNHIYKFAVYGSYTIKNFFVSKLYDSFSQINEKYQLCFLLSANTRLENTLLNAVLRIHTNLYNILTFGFFRHFDDNYLVQFLHLNFFHFFNLVEAKMNRLSLLLLNSKRTIIIFGESLLKRMTNFSLFFTIIKSFFCHVIFLKVLLQCNTEGLEFFNIKNVNTRLLKKVDYITAVDLEDSCLINKSLCIPSFANLFWINTHKTDMISTLAFKKKVSLFLNPFSHSFEEEKLFLNSEHSVKKTTKFLYNKELLNLKGIINTLLLDVGQETKFFSYSFHLQYLIDLSTSVITSVCFFNSKVIKNIYYLKIEYIHNLPIKNSMEDFFLSTKSLQHSRNMFSCSQFFRNSSNNFYQE